MCWQFFVTAQHIVRLGNQFQYNGLGEWHMLAISLAHSRRADTVQLFPCPKPHSLGHCLKFRVDNAWLQQCLEYLHSRQQLWRLLTRLLHTCEFYHKHVESLVCLLA